MASIISSNEVVSSSLCVEDVVSDVQKTMEYAEGFVRQQAEHNINKVINNTILIK